MKGMREIAWVCGVNLLILGGYTIFLSVEAHEIYLASVGLAELVIIQVMLCVLIAMMLHVAGKNAWYKGFLLAALTVLVAGFPACAIVTEAGS